MDQLDLLDPKEQKVCPHKRRWLLYVTKELRVHPVLLVCLENLAQSKDAKVLSTSKDLLVIVERRDVKVIKVSVETPDQMGLKERPDQSDPRESREKLDLQVMLVWMDRRESVEPRVLVELQEERVTAEHQG